MSLGKQVLGELASWAIVLGLLAAVLLSCRAFADGDYSFAMTIGPQTQYLDKAQAAFEKNDRFGWNWQKFKNDGTLVCRDLAQLRVCEFTLAGIDPDTGGVSGWTQHAFACSISDCAWIRDRGCTAPAP